MSEILQKHNALWSQKSFWVAVLTGFLLLALGLGVTYLANNYTEEHASSRVTDIILDNLPTLNVNFIYSEGAILFLIIVTLILLYEPRRIPFSLKAVALFVTIRSIFLVLTHLAPPAHGSYVDTSSLIYKFSSGDDLFFSAHTGLPFLLAAAFWNNKHLRYFFLGASVIGGASVLLGHLHYSIDVLSAPFIAFGAFHAAKWLFSKDHQLFSAPIAMAYDHVVG